MIWICIIVKDIDLAAPKWAQCTSLSAETVRFRNGQARERRAPCRLFIPVMLNISVYTGVEFNVFRNKVGILSAKLQGTQSGRVTGPFMKTTLNGGK